MTNARTTGHLSPLAGDRSEFARYTVGKSGVGSLRQLLSLVVLYLALSVFVVVVLGIVTRLAGPAAECVKC